MGLCSDRSVRFLKGLGYNVVRIPQASITPGQLIGVFKGDRRLIGAGVHQIFDSNPRALPPTSQDTAAADINGQRTSKLPIELGLDILGSVLGAFGAQAGLVAKYQSARTVRFTYEDVLSDSIDIMALGNYIVGGDVAWANPVLRRYLSDGGRLYVISSTIKSKKFTVQAERKDGASLGLTLPQIQPLAGAKLSVGIDAERADTVTYEGTNPLVFGFTCVELAAVDDGGDVGELKLSYRPVEAGGAWLSISRDGAMGVPPPAILSDDGLIGELAPYSDDDSAG